MVGIRTQDITQVIIEMRLLTSLNGELSPASLCRDGKIVACTSMSRAFVPMDVVEGELVSQEAFSESPEVV